MPDRVRVIFFGTPQFSAETLKTLVADSRIEVACVVTQPDSPQGRGLKLQASAVKRFAVEQGLTVLEPRKVPRESLGLDDTRLFPRRLRELGPFDAGVVVSYGKILPAWLLGLPTHGMLNVHPSLLPRWRGAAPIEWTLYSGDSETAVSIMQLDEGMDTGPVYRVERVAVHDDDNKATLEDRLARIGARLISETVVEVVRAGLRAEPQQESGMTYAEKWLPADCAIRWGEPGSVTHNRIRASSPDYGGVTSWQGKRLKIFRGKLLPASPSLAGSPGEVVRAGKDMLHIATGDGVLYSAEELQLEGKKRLSISEFLRGVRIDQGAKLGGES